VPLPLIDTPTGLLWFANQGAIEFHLWSSYTSDLSQPDLAIFDLDPGESASFDAVREAALRLHDALKQAGVRAYPKTNGGAGCTSLCRSGPVTPSSACAPGSRPWATSSRRTTPPWWPAARRDLRGHVTVDYAQNSIGRNTAAPYTLRAHPAHPTVSTPLTWEEL
jgi:bifunctional non-homologous end joining protein LigD